MFFYLISIIFINYLGARCKGNMTYELSHNKAEGHPPPASD
jgi:hypothetical protein